MAIRFKTSDWRDAAADEFAFGVRAVTSEPVVLPHIGALINEDQSFTGREEPSILPIKGHYSKKDGVPAG